MLRLSDFVMGRKRFHNLSRGLCISGLECKWEVEIQYVNSSDHINTIFTNATLDFK